MSVFHCPGQDKRFWKPQDIYEINCPHCGNSMEFWKDEPQLKCKSCGKAVRNPKLDLGCAEWCSYASECLAHIAPRGVEGSLCDALVNELKHTFGEDERRIRHALDVLAYAEGILDDEGGDPLTVKASAILHDIGIQEAERKHGASGAEQHEREGLPLARIILEKLGVDRRHTDDICSIVGRHHSEQDTDSVEFRIVWDADHLVNSTEECAGKNLSELREYVEKTFRTKTGRALAEEKLLRGGISADAGRV